MKRREPQEDLNWCSRRCSHGSCNTKTGQSLPFAQLGLAGRIFQPRLPNHGNIGNYGSHHHGVQCTTHGFSPHVSESAFSGPEGLVGPIRNFIQLRAPQVSPLSNASPRYLASVNSYSGVAVCVWGGGGGGGGAPPGRPMGNILN
jgi:hypothetical protein